MARTSIISGLTMSAIFVASSAFSGDAAPPKEQPSPEVDARIKALEQRVKELEGQLQQERKGSRFGQDWHNFRRDMGRDFNDFFENMQKDFEQNFGSNGGWAPRGLADRKPRLGVELAPASDELRERFKNDVKDGAFVMSVQTSTPAERAGVQVGDAIVGFDDKIVGSPQDLIEAVRSAPAGAHDLKVTRKGEKLALKVELGEAAVGKFLEPDGDGWMRRGNDAAKTGGTNTKMQVEVKTSDLQMNNDLQQKLKLTDDQRKKMAEVLDKHAKALNEEAAAKMEPRRSRKGMMTLNALDNSTLQPMIEKHAADTEKELAGTLSAEQIKDWQEWRRENKSTSISQHMMMEGGVNTGADDGNLGF